MSGSNSAERKRHEPLVLVETADISEEDWLDYRRRGIGGSDGSAIFGTSPFRTARDLYYDKLNIASVEDDVGNWVAMEMGHLLEPLVAKIFERKTGYRVYQIKKMFQHPQYPWMLADVDYFVELPDGLVFCSVRPLPDRLPWRCRAGRRQSPAHKPSTSMAFRLSRRPTPSKAATMFSLRS